MDYPNDHWLAFDDELRAEKELDEMELKHVYIDSATNELVIRTESRFKLNEDIRDSIADCYYKIENLWESKNDSYEENE